MEEELEYINNRPQLKYALLTFGEYFKLNHAISIAKGWTIGQKTERSYDMNPQAAKVNLQYDSEGNEVSYDEALVIPISAELQIGYPELINGIELVDSYIPLETSITEIIATNLTTEEEEWFLEHFLRVGNIDGVEVIWLESGVVLNEELITKITDLGITIILPDEEA